MIDGQDFVRLDHAAEMLDLSPDCRLAVLPGTKHTEVMRRWSTFGRSSGPSWPSVPRHSTHRTGLGPAFLGSF